MKVSRKDIIARRKARKKQAQRHELNKSIFKSVNVGLVLFSSAAVLSHVALPQTAVQAQDSVNTRTDFLKLVGNYAKNIAAKNDLYGSVMVAQAILESAWGKSGLAAAPNYNLFGIKGEYNGNSVKMDTLEDDGKGNYYQIKEPFRKYSNYGESLSDYASLLTGDGDTSSWRYNFYKGARVSQTNSYEDATKYLTGRYATDTRYGSKLNQLIRDYDLTQYDAVVKKPTTPSTTTNTATPSQPTATTGGYTVKAGDSYWKIANQYGISIAELQRLNGTNNYNLYPGQSLKVPGTSTSATKPTETKPSTSTTNNTAKPATPSQPTATTGGYTVKAGDSYWKIANQYGISIAELQRLNGTNNYNLYPGQSLKVPGTSTSATKPTETKPSTSTTNNTAKPATPSQPTATTGGYTVKAGDSYWKIANQYGISIAELQRLNGTNNYNLYPGQSLKVPGAGNTTVTATTVAPAPVSQPSTATSVTPTPTVTSSTAGGGYTVQAGDSYWKIATKYGISISELQRLNGTNNYNLYPGQSLKVPGSSAVTAAPASQNETPAPSANVSQPTQPVAPTQPDTSQPTVQPTPSTTTTSATHGSYTVKAGDSLYAIAQRTGTDVYKLIANNGGSNFIQIGQVISLD